MARRFHSKRKIKFSKLLFIIILVLLLFFFYRFISKYKIKSLGDQRLLLLASGYSNYSYKGERNDNSLAYVFNKITGLINEPQELVLTDLVYKSNGEDKKSKNFKKITVENQPLVYIYNTHQKEAYSMEHIEDYNVLPDVLLMSHILQEKLNNEMITTVVEENDITKYLKDNDMDYSESYKASRVYLLEAIKKYPNLKLIIDLHRDAASFDVSSFNANNKSYAKVMFVVGKEYSSYASNLETTNNINDRIDRLLPGLSRGVLQKQGKGVNGVYNQDLNSNIILLELGGDKNNIEQLLNTIDILVPAIKEYINEKK